MSSRFKSFRRLALRNQQSDMLAHHAQCSCFPVRVAPGGGIESFEETLTSFCGLNGRVPFSTGFVGLMSLLPMAWTVPSMLSTCFWESMMVVRPSW